MKSSLSSDETLCVATLVYYGLLSNAALVASEVWRWQINEKGEQSRASLYAITQSLHSLVQKNIIREYNGFYSLVSHNQPSYAQRMCAIITTGQKWSIARRKAFFLPYIPFVRSVRVIGSLPLATTRATSDIDISIGSARSHLWIARAFTLLVAHLLGVRRHHDRSVNRLCFNHYLGVSGVRIEQSPSSQVGHILSKTLFHTTYQSAVVWSKSQAVSLPLVQAPHSFLLSMKDWCERFLSVTGLDSFLERHLCALQIRHIQNHSLYSEELSPLSLETHHLVFSYQKIADTEQRFQYAMQMLLSQISAREELGPHNKRV